jgi:type IV secretion system protein VirB9
MQIFAKSLTLGLLVGLLMSNPAFALELPHQIGDDPHIQGFDYTPQDVFQISTKIGVATVIQLEDGERVAGDVSGLGMGDSKAWKVTVSGSNIFMKPAGDFPDTNMVLVTDRRTYAFKVVTAKKGEPVSYVVRFAYPDTEKRLKTQAAAAAAQAAATQAAINAKVGAIIPPIINTDYQMLADKKSLILAPSRLWDDGRFTYFKYPNGKDLPAVYKLLPDGTEALVNSHIDGDTLVVHEKAAGFILRLGSLVMQIKNSQKNQATRFNDSGTSVMGAIRIEKGEAK